MVIAGVGIADGRTPLRMTATVPVVESDKIVVSGFDEEQLLQIVKSGVMGVEVESLASIWPRRSNIIVTG